MVVRDLHRQSRLQGPLVQVAARDRDPAEVERELCDAGGALEEARGGTLAVLDLDHLGARAQSRLHFALDALARHGGGPVDPPPRLVATTAGDPAEAVRAKRLRPDLLARFDQWRIDLPPLRARKLDVGVLLAHFLDRWDLARNAAGAGGLAATPELVWALLRDPWPGNVPELQSRVEAACAAGDGFERYEEAGRLTPPAGAPTRGPRRS
jgi:DNA-binding NtrC family response regulator